MARPSSKWGYRLDHDAPPETRTEILETIRKGSEFEISDQDMKELARIFGHFNANRAHEQLKNRPRTRDVVKTLKQLADAWSQGVRLTEEIDDVTREHLIEVSDLLDAAELGMPVDLSILAEQARRKAAELRKELARHPKEREKSSDYTLFALVSDLSEFYANTTQKAAAANPSENYIARGMPDAETPFVRFVRQCLEGIEPRYLRSHSNSSSLGYRIREILRAKKLCPVAKKRCPPSGPFKTCPFDKKPCPCA